MKRYIARLTEAERAELSTLVKNGKAQAYRIKHANILLKVDADGPAWNDQETANAFGCHVNTVRNVRQRLVEEGLTVALERKKHAKAPRQQVLDGEGEARLVTLACGEAPAGRARWTMQLLADKLIELEIVPSISHETVRQTLKKMNSSLTCASAG